MAAKSTSRRADQKQLADELGVTDRRVRQLIEEHILPAAHHADGRYDLQLCRDRYELYRNGSDRDWNIFYDEAEDAVSTTAAAVDRALAPGASLGDVTAASLAIQASTAAMMFLTACRSKSDAERAVFFPIWRREEDDALRSLMARALELMGASRVVDDDTGAVLATLLSRVDPKKPVAGKRKARGGAVARGAQ